MRSSLGRQKVRETMLDYAFAVPIIPGRVQHYRETFEELEGRGATNMRQRWPRRASDVSQPGC